MNNATRFIVAAIAIALSPAFLAGCSKFDTENAVQQTFTAQISDVTRTALSGGKVFWEEGDEIFINGVSFIASPDEQNPSVASFRKTNPAGPNAKPDSRGSYVATFACSFDSEKGKGVIPETVKYSESGGVQAPMLAKSKTNSLSFKNICSVLEVTLKGTETVSRIEFNASGSALSGEFAIPDGQTAVMSGSKGSAVLDLGAGVKLTKEGTVFRIAVPAGEYSGLNVKVTDSGCRAWQKTAGKVAAMSVNTIYRLSFTPAFPSVVDGALTGVYSIDDNGGKVNFSKGNLYYDDGWYFAGSQTDVPDAEWSDKRPVTHFFWTDDPAVAVGQNYDMDHEDAGDELFFTNSPDFKVYGNGSWRALSVREWDYLLNGRKFTVNHSAHYGEGYSYLRVILFKEGVYGLLLFPDGFTGQEEVMLQKYIPEGCAFLPCGGICLYGKGIAENESGAYWTPDANPVLGSTLSFGMGGVSIGTATNKFAGLSIRLVVPI
ncbi:MAG: hypothetical protein MJY41_00015 [Bacteroidales bacterium]|nr:hypothetical protein [Bacteroidales bacterium]